MILNNKARLAFVQYIYQDLFKVRFEVDSDLLSGNDPEVDYQEVEREFMALKPNIENYQKTISKFLNQADKTFLVTMAAMLGYIHESQTDSSEELIKRYMRVAEKLIGGKSVNTIHAVLVKIRKVAINQKK